MKKLTAFLAALVLCAAVLPALAADAVSSATLNITELPEIRENPDAKILVIYFSTDDTVKAAARTIADALDADVFEVVPEIPYSEADLAYYTNCRADREQADSSARPAISAWPESMEQYSTVFIGYPIWHGQAPKILYTLVEGIDLGGKTVIPFCTSASSGAGSSAKNLQAVSAGEAEWLDVTRIDNRSTAEDIRAWALSLGLEEMKTLLGNSDVTVTLTMD